VKSKDHSTQDAGERTVPALGIGSGSVRADGTIINWVAGVIQSQYVGLVRTGVRIKVGERTDLRVRWAMNNERLLSSDSEWSLRFLPRPFV
jgi:hypothetical protein